MGLCHICVRKNKNGDVHCSFLCGKSRVTPTKFQSVPRLELVAAVMAVQADKWLTKQLELHACNSIFWTDSCVVLGSIRNETKRFKTFVANRLAKIHRHTTAAQWRYVDTKLNPADDASRGLSVPKFLKSRWTKGPVFLWEAEDKWPTPPKASMNKSQLIPLEFQPIDQKMTGFVAHDKFQITLDDVVNHYSSIYKLKIACAWYIRFFAFLKDKSSVPRSRLTVEELENAEFRLIRYVQQQAFAPVFRLLKGSAPSTNKLIKRELRLNSQLRSLHKVSPNL